MDQLLCNGATSACHDERVSTLSGPHYGLAKPWAGRQPTLPIVELAFDGRQRCASVPWGVGEAV